MTELLKKLKTMVNNHSKTINQLAKSLNRAHEKIEEQNKMIKDIKFFMGYDRKKRNFNAFLTGFMDGMKDNTND